MEDSKLPLDMQRISNGAKAPGLSSIGNSFELQEDAHYPPYPA